MPSFAGGFAQGFSSGFNTVDGAIRTRDTRAANERNATLTERRLGLEEQRLDLTRRGQMLERANAARKNAMDLAATFGEVFKAARANGVAIDPKNLKAMEAAILTVQNTSAAADAAAGLQRDPLDVMGLARSFAAGALTPEQATQNAVDQTTAVTGAEREVNRTQDLLDQKAGTKAAPATPAVQAQNFVNPETGESEVVIMNSANAAEKIADLSARGYVKTGLNVEASGLEGLQSPTARTQGDLQENEILTTELLGNLENLEALLEGGGSDAVGASAALAGLMNRTVAQFAPGMFNEDRANFERLLKVTRQGALRMVSADSRFTNEDRERVEELFPSTGALESVKNAETKLTVLKAYILRRNLDAAQRLGVDQPDSPVNSPEDIAAMVRSGAFSMAEGEAALVFLFPEIFGTEANTND